MSKKFLFIWLLLVVISNSCRKGNAHKLFKYVPSNSSKITFANTITENDSINVINFQYCYNGGGVGMGDFNNDGLQDIVFTGNQVSSALYLNLGNLKFKDITISSNLSTSSWITGVSVVDIDQNGLDDIYFNVGGPNCNDDCNNLLFVNQGIKDGIPFFEERAQEYGLNDGNYSQQTVFLDYDLDGDLDAYTVRNGNSKFDKNAPVPKNYLPVHLKDLLLENNWDADKKHSVFTEVSKTMGIDHAGFGLGVAINDMNNDTYPDIYVSNDFITEDLLYINRGLDSLTGKHLGFFEKSKSFLAHETYNAMGVDISDVNNDTRPDILVLDMLPLDYKRQKKMLGSMNYDKYTMSLRNQYTPQYMHNTLQLNNGFLDSIPIKTSEVGFISGISSTDWSWAPLLMDYDNDGDKDIFITNGYVKDITDLDFINFSSQNNAFGTPEARNKRLIGFVDQLSGIHLPNFFYRNDGHQQFQDTSSEWVTETSSFSNGAAYADLDLDGDLDLVVNNINGMAFLMENTSSDNPENRYLRIQLKGNSKNIHALGATATVWNNGIQQTQYQSTVRGYLSSVESILHFGVTSERIDSIQVVWPNGKTSKRYDVATNQVLTLKQSEARDIQNTKVAKTYTFTEETQLLNFTHKENSSSDYVYQHLLMRQYSKSGPCIAAANIDGIAGDELYIGGSKDVPGQIWFQDTSGVYFPKQELDAIYEDTDAEFIDIDGDTDLDLYVSSGGNEFEKGSKNYEDRIYLNDGKGYFTRNETALPKAFQSNSCVRPRDIDNDGDMDFFIGARISPRTYPDIPSSKILINENGILSEQSNAISNLGMVTDALWQDIDNDGWDDLIIVGEWMPISIYRNDHGKLNPMPTHFLDENNNELPLTNGWWNCIKSADFDDDGDMDFIIGNQGLNGFVKPQKNKPVYLYKGDFDKNGSPDPIIAQYFNDKLLPVHTRDDITKQLVTLKNNFLTYDQFSKIDFKDILKIKDLEAETLKAATFSSSYMENIGAGKFRLVPLPIACQLAPINTILIDDFDHNGTIDALITGNDFSAETHYGRYDANTGIFLKNNGTDFTVVSSSDSGFYVPLQSNHMKSITDKKGRTFIITMQNNGKALVFKTQDTP